MSAPLTAGTGNWRRPELLTECSGEDCPCRQGVRVHPPVIMIFYPERGGYDLAEARCIARWAGSQSGHVAGQICGEAALRQLGDIWVCEYHYKRGVKWLEGKVSRDHEAELRNARELHQEQVRLDRERALKQRELDKENARLRSAEARKLALQEAHLYRERLKAEETARAENSRVYYVQRESDGLIKIGTSRTLADRLKNLRREHGPLRLIAAVGGSHAEEAALHRQFAELRTAGEWFRPGLPLLRHLRTVIREHALPSDPGLPPRLSGNAVSMMIYKLLREQESGQVAG